jgi:hypothetical protein
MRYVACRITSLAYAAILIGSVFTGCGASGGDNGSSEQAPSLAQGDAPYAYSTAMVNFTIDGSSYVQKGVFGADGSDQWPMTWGGDGALYAAWGDGLGWNGDLGRKSSLGVSSIQGIPPQVNGRDLAGWSDQNRKPVVLVSDNQSMYMLWNTDGDNWSGAWGARSLDLGKTWDLSIGKVFDKGMGVMPVGVYQFGPGYTQLPQGVDSSYIYMLFEFTRNGGGKDYCLGRVLRQEFFNADAYSYFGGLDETGQAFWIADRNTASIIFHDSNGREYQVGITYYPHLQRYIMVKAHKKFNLGIFESPSMWGPWSTVYYDQFKDTLWKFTYQVPQIWMGPDSFWIAFSGWPEYDNVNFVKAVFNAGKTASPAPK